MPKNITKPIVLIYGAKSLQNVQLSRYIHPESCSEIIYGTESIIDCIVSDWSKSNNLENIEFAPNYSIFKNDAINMRDKELVEFCDVVVVFYDGRDKNCLFIIDYAKKLKRKIIIHLIQEYD